MVARLALAASLAAQMIVCVCVPAIAEQRFTAVGGVTAINTRWQEFELSTDSADYTVLASYAAVRFQDGSAGEFRDIKQGALVRVYGERMSSRTVRADEVVVLDNDAGRFSARPRSYRPGERVEIEGTVVRAHPPEIDIRSDGRDFVVVIGAGTVVRRYLYVTDISEVREGDRVGVYGTVRDSRIEAERVQLIEPGAEYHPLYLDRREDVVEGEIVAPASSFDRTLALATPFGERKVDVKRGADVARDGVPISVHDLRRGELIRAYGVWDSGTLVASRVEVIRQIDRSEAAEEPARTEPEASEEPSTETVPDRESAPPAESTSEVPPASTPEGERTGRIVGIDYENVRLTIDMSLADLEVDAREAVVTRQGSSRRFSDLKMGDKVTVTGETRDGVFVARTVEIVE